MLQSFVLVPVHRDLADMSMQQCFVLQAMLCDRPSVVMQIALCVDGQLVVPF